MNILWQKASILFLLFKTEKDYSISKLLFQKYKKYNIVEEVNFSDTLKFRSFDFNSFDYSKQLLENIEKLVNTETSYLQRDEETKKILPKLALTLQIINYANDAIAKLDRVNASNKKISYYESSNHANIDDLIEHFKKKLKSTGEESLNFPMSKKEFKLKLFITRLKKRHNLVTNYYLSLLKFLDTTLFKLSEDEKKFLQGLESMIEFFTLGHASKYQIHKSVAIQLYSIYKNDFTHSQLTEMIGNIINIIFEPEKPYQNFNGFNQKKVYIKNRINNFILYDLNDEQSTLQIQKSKKFFDDIIVKDLNFFVRPIMRYMTNQLIDKPLVFMLLMEQIKSFGITPIKK